MIVKFLEKCARIEEVVSEIYLTFSENKHNDDVLAELWEELAKDEQDHCQQLRLAARMPVSESFAGIRDKCPDPEGLYQQAESILKDAKFRQFTLLDMLKTAVILEKEFRKLHALYALEFKDPSMKATFERLANSDQEHLKNLDAYLKKFKEEHLD